MKFDLNYNYVLVSSDGMIWDFDVYYNDVIEKYNAVALYYKDGNSFFRLWAKTDSDKEKFPYHVAGR